jgi:hypothetical protein
MTSRTRTEIQSRAVKEGVFACPIAARTRRSLQSFVGDLFNMQEFFGLVVSAGFTHGNDPYYLMMPVGRSGAQFRTRLLFIAALSNLEIFMRIATRGWRFSAAVPATTFTFYFSNGNSLSQWR